MRLSARSRPVLAFYCDYGYMRERKNELLRYILIGLSAVAITVSVGSLALHRHNQNAWHRDALAGKVALTQPQLESLVAQESITVYWAGPRPGYLYSIDTTAKSRVYLQYIQADSNSKNVIANSRIIATYFTKDGFGRTVSAATRTGNTGFRNPNGSVVFYAKNRATDIYLAFPGKEVQVEIFDPLAGQALSLAVLQDQITEIGVCDVACGR
jgi:hypothetical protein